MAKAATRTDTEPNKTKSSNKKKVLKKKPEKRGRKSYYDWKVKPKLHLVADWARNGVLDNEIYKKLGVGKDAFYDYKKKYPELRDALQTRDEADAQVEAALFKNACGFHYEESQTLTRYSEKDGTITETRIFKKYKEPDTTAQAIWLNNRRPESWKQKQREYDSNGKDGEPDPITKSILDHVKSLDGEEE